ncbi:MAG: bifunctional salicylyl-CoA 5-hydroxylase/oxidoreductase [Burkholderiaceae bacterium]
MNIQIVGAGPAGLYFAILAKKSFPDARIEVSERNQADDTFGFGIVLSDETLGNLRRADEPTYREIAAHFAYWDDIYTLFKGTVSRSTGHGFSGVRRLTLLQILQRRAAELGVTLRYGVDDGGIASHPDADLIVAADGINSQIRDALKTSFAPEVDLRTNRFTWLGARMNLPGFTYSFREDTISPTDGPYKPGIWNMHAYEYTSRDRDDPDAPVGECTIVIETTDEAFHASGLAATDEVATAKFVETLFAEELQGNAVLTNRSHWRQFPTITCKTWHHAVTRPDGRTTQVVLLGDSAHTAHFSIGSGTKLALEDAIALHAAVVAQPDDLRHALAHYEAGRRDEVGRIQHSANVSLVWFENVRRFWAMEPIQFNYSLLSRSKQITHENLRLRDAALVADVETWWNDGVARELGVTLPASFKATPMFSPLTLRGMQLANRVVVSPMAQYSAVDGMPNDWHFVHYTTRAIGGAGLVFVEMTCPSADARITPGCTGLWNVAQADAWQRIVDFGHAHSAAKLCMQLGHAGRKGSTQVGWEKMDNPLDEVLHGPNWGLFAPSPIAYREGVNATPRVMTPKDMDRIRDQFVASARLAERAGFDMLELHMAHGYLLASFISPVTNQRDDAYGGNLTNRLRFPLEVWDAVRAVWPKDKPMSVRLSATDWMAGGTTAADTVEIAKIFKAHGCDLIDVSTGQTDPASKPVYGRMYQATFAEQVRLEAGITTMAVGAVTTGDQVNTLLASGRADLVALARPHLANPYFTLHAAADAGYDGVSWPAQYVPGAQQAATLAKRAREDAAKRIAEAERPRHG